MVSTKGCGAPSSTTIEVYMEKPFEHKTVIGDGTDSGDIRRSTSLNYAVYSF
jgi:hypothetical protein